MEYLFEEDNITEDDVLKALYASDQISNIFKEPEAEEKLSRSEILPPLYEGCGQEGRIRSIFLAEFHPTEGPRIRCQAPEGVVPLDVLEAISVYIIPKQDMTRISFTINVLGYKISGYPVILENDKFKRNQLMFNLCFVCHPWSRTVHYEPVVKKLSDFLVNLELETEYISLKENTEAIRKLLQSIYSDLNGSLSKSTIEVGDNSLQLLLSHRPPPDPPEVYGYDVPLLLVQIGSDISHHWDLTTQRLVPFINGVNHVTLMAYLANIDVNLVRLTIQNLVYYNVVCIVPIFQFSNSYAVTSKIEILLKHSSAAIPSEHIMKELLDFAALPSDMSLPRADYGSIFELITAFKKGRCVRDLVDQFKPRKNLGIDIHKLVQILVLRGILRRIRKYPVYVKPVTVEDESSSMPSESSPPLNSDGAVEYLDQYFTGKLCLDEIAIKTGETPHRIQQRVKDNPNVYILYK